MSTKDKEPTGLQMKYFVLKPSGDSAYATASREAFRAYAESIRAVNPELAEELAEWRRRELKKVRPIRSAGFNFNERNKK